MIKNGITICDDTGIVLEDKNSLYPKYISVEDGQVYEHDNDGTISKEFRPGVPKTNITKEKLFKTDPVLNGKHFISLSSLYGYLTKLRIDKKNKKE